MQVCNSNPYFESWKHLNNIADCLMYLFKRHILLRIIPCGSYYYFLHAVSLTIGPYLFTYISRVGIFKQSIFLGDSTVHHCQDKMFTLFSSIKYGSSIIQISFKNRQKPSKIIAKPQHISYFNSKHFTSIVPPMQVLSTQIYAVPICQCLEHSTSRGQNRQPPSQRS